MATVAVELENDSSQEAAQECNTEWSPTDDDFGQQHADFEFHQIFIKEEVHVEQEEEEESSVKSKPEMRPSETANATEVGALNAHSISPVEKCTERLEKVVLKKKELYSCSVCGSKTSLFHSLKRHIRKHTGEKPFSCKFCDYKGTQSSHFKARIKTHTGEKPFHCELCDYKSAKLSNLKVHIRSHTGEKPFSCKFCDLKFADSSYLKGHHKIHTGEKPFSCKSCDYKSTRSSDLKRHLQIHTQETTSS